MSENEIGGQPTPLAIAKIVESMSLREDPYAECRPALSQMLRDGERSRELFEELTRPRDDGAPSLLELAKLVLAVSDRRFSDCHETLTWVVQQSASGRRAYEELSRMSEDTGDVVAGARWPVGVVQRHHEVDMLVAADDEWTDPMKVLDPSCDTVNPDGAYAQWLAICRARRQRQEGDLDRLDAVIEKIEAAGEAASLVARLVAGIDLFHPLLADLKQVFALRNRLNPPPRGRVEEAEP